MSKAADLSIREREGLQYRRVAREIFARALAHSTIEQAFSRRIERTGGTLRIGDDLYPLSDYARVSVVSVGKGAHSMAEALVKCVGGQLNGIVAGTTEPPVQIHGFRYFRGGHPTPTAESLEAGRAILRYVSGQPENALIVFLISGGGSAAAEYPAGGITLADLIETYRVLVLSGAPIAQINAIRKHLSAIKGGRLARAASPAQQVSILVSDVPDNAPDSLASGITMPDSTTVEDCYRIAAEYGILPAFPPAVREMFTGRMLEETPKKGDPAFARARWWPVLSNRSVLEAASAAAAQHGFVVEVDTSCDDWDYARAADYLLERVRELRRVAPRVCLVSGGEVTVRVAAGAGIGGRNQQFALYCAEKIAYENIAVLSAGTDGVDGNSAAAGAVVDGTTLERARQQGLEPAAALARFDAFPLLDRLHDSILTGPTGNNLRDLRLLMSW